MPASLHQWSRRSDAASRSLTRARQSADASGVSQEPQLHAHAAEIESGHTFRALTISRQQFATPITTSNLAKPEIGSFPPAPSRGRDELKKKLQVCCSPPKTAPQETIFTSSRPAPHPTAILSRPLSSLIPYMRGRMNTQIVSKPSHRRVMEHAAIIACGTAASTG